MSYNNIKKKENVYIYIDKDETYIKIHYIDIYIAYNNMMKIFRFSLNFHKRIRFYKRRKKKVIVKK